MFREQEPSIIIVDDEQHLLDSLALTLRSKGYEHVFTCTQGSEVLSLLNEQRCQVVLLDLFLPDLSGEEVLSRICTEHPYASVIIITGNNEVETAVRCIQAGALDYLVKPVEQKRLVTSVDRALKHSAILLENRRLRSRLLHQEVQNPQAFEHILTRCPQMQSIFNYLEVIAPARDPVLITGETGTGKDLLARSLHLASRRNGRFLQVNTAGLDEQMFADTLFGHVRGAFTDARQSREGLVEQSRGGTLFLDEIGDLPHGSQVKLLHLIQNQEYFPLGADQPKKADVRIAAVTNRNLETRIQEGHFRKDLYYRLSTYHVHLPPLRERPEDIVLLTEHFLEEAAGELGLERSPLPRHLASWLKSCDLPGNVRELRSLVFDGLARGGIPGLEEKLRSLTGREDPPEECPGFYTHSREPGFPETLPTLESAIQSLIQEALRRTGGNKARAARMLGISKQAMHQRLRKK